MVDLDAEHFEKLVAKAIDGIPDRYSQHMQNVGFVIEDTPSEDQRLKLHLAGGMTLYGLYEGIPLTQRGNGYSGVLPDKITIFRLPMLQQASDLEELEEIVKNTVWHEVAHHFGLGHGRINELESQNNK